MMRQQKKWIVICAGVLTAFAVTILWAIVCPIGISPLYAHATDIEPIQSRGLIVNDVLVVPAADFRLDRGSGNEPLFLFHGGFWGGSTTGSTCFMAPVYVPHGSEIYQVFATVYNNHPTSNLTISLRRLDNYSVVHTNLADMSSTNPSASIHGIHNVNVTNGEVSYPQYSYYLTTCLSSNLHRLYNVRVWYRYEYAQSTFLPLVVR